MDVVLSGFDGVQRQPVMRAHDGHGVTVGDVGEGGPAWDEGVGLGLPEGLHTPLDFVEHCRERLARFLVVLRGAVEYDRMNPR